MPNGAQLDLNRNLRTSGHNPVQHVHRRILLVDPACQPPPITTEFVPRKHAICRCLAGVRSFPFQTQSVLDVYARTDHVLHVEVIFSMIFMCNRSRTLQERTFIFHILET